MKDIQCEKYVRNAEIFCYQYQHSAEEDPCKNCWWNKNREKNLSSSKE